MTNLIIRAPRDDEAASLIRICAQSGLFTDDELAGFSAQIEGDAESGNLAEQWRVVGSDTLQAAALFGPEQMADGVWNLWFIAVLPELRGTKLGRTLLSTVEEVVRDQGGRILIVETSSQASFTATRRFYTARGYEEEARIRDWYGDGDAKVIFRKRLT